MSAALSAARSALGAARQAHARACGPAAVWQARHVTRSFAAPAGGAHSHGIFKNLPKKVKIVEVGARDGLQNGVCVCEADRDWREREMGRGVEGVGLRGG